MFVLNNDIDEYDDDRWCNCIALHDFQNESVKWQEWFEFALSFYAKHGLEPTRLAVNGTRYGNSVKSLTFKGGLKKLQKYNFKDIEDLIFMAMPNKDDYTTNFIINSSLSSDKKNSNTSEVVMCFDEKLEAFNYEIFAGIANNLHKFTNAKYGYYYHRHLKNSPDIYSTGGNSPFVDENDKEKCFTWTKKYIYNTNKFYRTGNLRDIYKLNFLSLEHLDWQINDQQTLRQWINSSPNHGTLNELSTGFWSWYVEESQIPNVRKSLIPSGIILCV